MSRTGKDKPVEEVLLELKQKIEDAKSAKARSEGTRDEILRRLREEHGCKTIAEAQKKIKELERSIAQDGAKLEQGVAKLESILVGEGR